MKFHRLLSILLVMGILGKTLAFYNNELLTPPGGGPVWVYFDGRKYGIPSPSTFEALSYRWSDVHQHSWNSLNSVPTGSTIPEIRNGVLLVRPEGGAVFVLWDVRKHWIPNPTTFEALGYSWGSIQSCPQFALDRLLTGPTLPNVRWGESIHDASTGAVFIAWGGKWGVASPTALYAIRGKPDGNYSPWSHIKTFPPTGVINSVTTRTTIHGLWSSASLLWGECTWGVGLRRNIPRWYWDEVRRVWRGGDGKDWYAAAYARFWQFAGGDGPGWLACNHPDRPPVPGAIMCFGASYPGSRGYGHVAFVEAVDYETNRVYIAHTWAALRGAIRREWVPMWGWRGHSGYIF